MRSRALAGVGIAVVAALPAGAGATVIRVGGPSAPDESKVAIVGSDKRLAGESFEVVDAAGTTVLSGELKRAPGDPAPFNRAYRADLSGVTTPGDYRVSIGRKRSGPWTVAADGATPLLDIGEEAGVLMPSGCRMGICFGCVTPLKAGAVRDLRTGEITEAEPGVLIQTCVSAAAGPCDIER